MRRTLGLVVVLMGVAGAARAEPVPKSDPAMCPSAFDCGALAARLAAVDGDYPGALRASARACKMDPAQFCDDYADMLISAGKSRGGDPDKGVRMLESQCTAGNTFACGHLSRVYDDPPVASGLPRRRDDAARVLSADCDRGVSTSCGVLSNLYEHGCAHRTKSCPPGPTDKKKALAALEKACHTGDTYAKGYCAQLGDKLARGTLGPVDRVRGRALVEDACASGYYCDDAVDLALEDGDLATAKKMAKIAKAAKSR